MNYDTLKGAHEGIIYLFLIWLIFKILFLLVNQKRFSSFRDKTRFVEIILGPMILASGLWLWREYQWTAFNWLTIKIILFIIAIPLTIISFKKENKVLAVVALLLFIAAYLLAQYKTKIIASKSIPDSQEIVSTIQHIPDHALVFEQRECTFFHATLRSDEFKPLAFHSIAEKTHPTGSLTIRSGWLKIR